jgi:DNA helicase-2/ATP-dependent DNA helicase PcrA
LELFSLGRRDLTRNKIAVGRTFKDGDEVLPARLLDLMVVSIGYDAFMEWVEIVNPSDTKTLKLLNNRIESVFRRWLPQVIAGFEQHLAPLADKNPVLMPAVRVTRLPAPVFQRARNISQAGMEIFPWLSSRVGLLREIFSSGRETALAHSLSAVSQEENPASRLNKAAGSRFVSGDLSTIRNWLIDAAAFAGTPVSETEQIMAGAETAKGVASELAEVTSSLGVTDPNTPQAAELESRKIDLIKSIQQIADSSPDPSAVMSAAVSGTPQHAGWRTETGKQLGHSPMQEEAMMVRGKALIAATAGSGKTRVLASKVKYHMTELGVPSTAILATSFTRKAAHELIKRIQTFGSNIDSEALRNFGTSHSIAGNIINRQGGSFKRKRYAGVREKWIESTLLKLAMAQVKMTDDAAPNPPPETSMFANIFATGRPHHMGDPRQARNPKVQQRAAPNNSLDTSANTLTFSQALSKAYQNLHLMKNPFLKGVLRSYFEDDGKWFAINRKLTDNLKSPARLSAVQKVQMQDIFNMTGVQFDIGVGGMPKRAAVDHPMERLSAEESTGPDLKKGRRADEYVYFKQPAGEWFNLGNPLVRKTDKGEEPIPPSEFKTYITRMKGLAISPTEAWHGKDVASSTGDSEGGDTVDYSGEENVHAAVYAAYEWLKGPHGEAAFQGIGDMNDILIDTVQALIGQPELLANLQRKFKVILVDEAQDSNTVQYYLYGLLAGYLDPATLKPRADGKMTADTYAWIGDDSQAIYAFRGANPEQFTALSDLKGGDFVTKSLDTNYRSGKQIVEAAQRLVQHNKNRIPLVCKANPERKDEGRVETVRQPAVEDAAKYVASQVAELVQDESSGHTRYSDFGIAVRTNAEAFHYGLEMLKKGIPFRSPVSFFGDPLTKGLVQWLTLAELGVDGPKEEVNEIVVSATKFPKTRISGDSLLQNLLDKAQSQNWLKWLINGGVNVIYPSKNRGDRGWSYNDLLAEYTENLAKVASFQGTPKEILNQILDLRGFEGKTIIESMMEAVSEDEEKMALLLAESEVVQVTEEQIRTLALGPVEPLIGLLENHESMASAMDYVRKLQRANEKLSVGTEEDEETYSRDAVQILTMHGWKGLEVPHMYVPVVGGRFPRCGKSGTAGEGPDLWGERRLAYVAITRAENRCTLLDIPHPTLGISSQFLYEACIPYATPDGTLIPDGAPITDAAPQEGVRERSGPWEDEDGWDPADEAPEDIARSLEGWEPPEEEPPTGYEEEDELAQYENGEELARRLASLFIRGSR